MPTIPHPAPTPVIHVVDDDEGMRAAIISLLESHGWHVQGHASARKFLEAERVGQLACLILDVNMPGVSGFDLQSELKRLGENCATIFLTGYGTIPLSVRAMREGAVEFLTKPFTEQELISAVQLAVQTETVRWAHNEAEGAARWRYETLTYREREVFAFVASGRMNKVIAGDLGIAEVTVKLHRARIMDKLAVKTLADLVRLATQLNIPLP